jgi:hypothetical protein
MVAGILIDGAEEVTDEMTIEIVEGVPEERIFEPATQEVLIDLFALGVERTILAYRHQLISRIAMWPSTLAELEAEITKEVLG